MSDNLAFIGDIHGNLGAVRGLWDALAIRRVQQVVFLGDYINKGAESAEVLQELIAHADSDGAILLAGNHETTLLEALDAQDLSGFLKMGGAATIRSYVRGRVGADVLGSFIAEVPQAHINALRSMSVTYETESLVAQHIPAQSPTHKFRISAHVPVGLRPSIDDVSAQIDTGCGSPQGRLTGLLWPSLNFIQVHNDGSLVTD